MSASSRIATFLINRFWPFFQKYIWPLIRDEVIKAFTRTVEVLVKRYEALLKERGTANTHYAKAQAEAAEVRATTASSAAEAEKHRAVAEVWRQVAENYRQENEALREQIVQLTKNATAEAEQSVNDIRIEVKRNQVQLRSGDNIIALPSPSGEPSDLS